MSSEKEIGTMENNVQESKAKLTINIGDWVILAMRNEVDIQDDHDLVELVQKFSTADVARMTVASRHLKKSPEDILDTDKMLLEHGARAGIAERVSRAVIKISVGKQEIDLPEVTGSVEAFGPEEDEEPGHYVSTLSKEAVDRAVHYLARIIPGHIRGRLRTLAANGVRLGPAVEDLKREIDQIVEELTA